MTDTIDFEIVVDDGYPTEEALRAIRYWTGTPRNLVDGLLEPVFRPGGLVGVETGDRHGREVYVVTLVTGGWSGCESAITALNKGFWRVAYWESDHRGGKHVYEVPTDRYDENQPAWEIPTGYEAVEQNTLARAIRAVETARTEHAAATADAEGDPVLGLPRTLLLRAYDDAIRAITGLDPEEGDG